MEEKLSYYIVIPTPIYDDETLKDSAKLLYGLISSLINEKGYCFASNEYLAIKRNTTSQNISRLLKELEKKEYIVIIYLRDGAIVKNRKIYINSRLTEMLMAINQNVKHTVNQNVKESNKAIYSIRNNKEKIYKKEKFKKPTLKEVQKYCEETNSKIDCQHFIDYYESKGWLIGKSPMKDWKAAIRTWVHNKKKYETKKTAFDLIDEL